MRPQRGIARRRPPWASSSACTASATRRAKGKDNNLLGAVYTAMGACALRPPCNLPRGNKRGPTIGDGAAQPGPPRL